MSVEAMALVLHHSKATGTAKVILLGIANHEGDGGAWPSLATLAKYANCTVRQVRRCLRDLEAAGEIYTLIQEGGTKTTDHMKPNLYRVLVRCPRDCDRSTRHRTPPDMGVRGGRTQMSGVPRTQMSSKPSEESSKEPSGKDMAQRSAPSVSVSDLEVFAEVWERNGGDAADARRAYDDIRSWESALYPGAWSVALEARGEFEGYVRAKGPGTEGSAA